MKKYRNFIIVTIISGLLGGLIGIFGNMGITIDLNFISSPRLIAFRIFLVIAIVMVISIIAMIANLKMKFKKIDIENIPNSIDKSINYLLYISTTFIILSFTWMGVMISRSFGEIEGSYLATSVISLTISTILQTLAVVVYNKYYPNKKLNIYQNDADKNLFDKLDEGEKWIVYICSYSTFQIMQLVYSVMMILTIILSIFTSISILLPIVIGLLWITQTSIYSIKANKYNSEDI